MQSHRALLAIPKKAICSVVSRRWLFDIPEPLVKQGDTLVEVGDGRNLQDLIYMVHKDLAL